MTLLDVARNAAEQDERYKLAVLSLLNQINEKLDMLLRSPSPPRTTDLGSDADLTPAAPRDAERDVSKG